VLGGGLFRGEQLGGGLSHGADINSSAVRASKHYPSTGFVNHPQRYPRERGAQDARRQGFSDVHTIFK
jgi:hypothetical protein